MSSSRLSTGVSALDVALGGGFAPGHLVALTAAPASQSEALLYAMAAAYPNRYLSTLRPAAAVREDAACAGFDGVTVERADGDALLRDPEGHLAGLDPDSVVVVDPATELEQAGETEYRGFLDALERALRGTDSVGVLHCPELSPATLRRDLTLVRADVVLDFRVEYESGHGRATLAVPKHRRGRPVLDPIEIRFDDRGGLVRGNAEDAGETGDTEDGEDTERK